MDKALWDKVQSQASDWKPPSDPGSPDQPAEEPQKGWTFGQKLSDVGGDLSAFAGRALQGVDLLEKSAIYGVARPFLPEKAPSWMLPVLEQQTKAIQERTKEPKTTVGRVLGPAIEGAVATAALPIPGGIARNVVAGMGMGELSDIGGNVLGGLFKYFGGEEGRKIGEATGQILGGGIGAQANVTRVQAMGAALQAPYQSTKSAVQAGRSAWEIKKAGDERALWQIFADEFGSLRSNTRGIVQDFVNRHLAATIQKDLMATEASRRFTEDAKLTGMDVKPWGLGERTLVPTITETVAGAKPESYAEGSEIMGRATAMKKSIVDAYNRLVTGTKIPTTPDGIEGSAKVFQKITQIKVDALTQEANAIKQQSPALTASESMQIGEKARSIRDQLRDEAFARGKARYQQAEQLWDAEGATVEPGNVRDAAKGILSEFYSKVKPDEVPPVVRNLLSATGKESAAAESGLLLPADIAAEKAAAAAAQEAAGKPLTLKEANDLYKALGEAGANAQSAEKFTAANRARQLQGQLVDAITGAKATPEAKKAWQDAVAGWRDDYATRFQEGLGKALGKERGGAYEGREMVLSEDIMDKALQKPSFMGEFDKVFGGNKEADQLLGRQLDNKFRKEVLDGHYTEEGFQRKLEAFKSKYSAGLERFPQIAEKVDSQAAQFFNKQAQIKSEIERYKDIMRGDITDAVGPLQAKQMFQAALADPIKMERLMNAYKGAPRDLVEEVFRQANPFKNGEYDAEAILKMVQAGKRTGETPSSMEILFSKAFGPAQGQRHLATLEAIANFTLRQAATDPRFLRAPEMIGESMVKTGTGQSVASHISAWRSAWLGQTSKTYPVVLSLSRFANARVQKAIEQAKHRALYDPETADAILEMVAKPATEPLSMTTAKKIFGDIRLADGQKLIDRLIDRGYVKSYISRGLIYGEEKALQEQTDPTSRTGARHAAQER